MQPEIIEDLTLQEQSLFTPPRLGGRLVTFGAPQTLSQKISCGSSKKTEIKDIISEWVPLMIMFIICGKKGILFLFWDCLNVMRFYHGKFVKLHGLKLICDII